jgi:hypothetical protein
VLRPYDGSPIILVSDGSAPSGRIGWGALVAEASGAILATTCGGVQVHVATSWAAEWCGKYAALQLAAALSVPPSAYTWAIADNVACALGSDGGRPSSSHIIDNIRLAYAAAAAPTALREGFTPAQHNTGWRHLIATLQARCHLLADAGVRQAQANAVPFLHLNTDLALLLHNGALVLSIGPTLNQLYAQAHPAPPAALPAAGRELTPLLRWAEIIESGVVPSGALRLAALLRAAPLFPSIATCPFHCSICLMPCPGWGTHLLHDCPLIALALLHAFSRVADTLAAAGHTITWTTPTHFSACLNSAPATQWYLTADSDLDSSRPTAAAAYVSWSGLVWPPTAPHLLAATCRCIAVTYLTSLEEWVTAVPERRWRLLQYHPLHPPPSNSALLLALATLLRWTLRIPDHLLLGPIADSVGTLRRPASPSDIALSCGALPPPDVTSHVSILSSHPGPLSDTLQLIHLPGGLFLVSSYHPLPLHLRRTLDVLHPPPAEYLDLSVWTGELVDHRPDHSQHRANPETPSEDTSTESQTDDSEVDPTDDNIF